MKALALGIAACMASWMASAYAQQPALAQFQGEVDLSGGWLQKVHQDAGEQAEAEIGDYTGMPINEAARLRADTWDSAKWSIPEHQCEPHPADYAMHGPANLQISKLIDAHSLKTTAIQVRLGWMTPVRTIWLDGRPEPPSNSPYTWMGFSTGQWEGDTLKVRTTHLKEGWLRRNGLPRSDRAILTEYWMRHDNVLTIASVIEDPVYLTEPFFRTHQWVLDEGVHITPYTCVAKLETDRPQGFVAHYLPGTNPFLKEFAARRHLPQLLAEGGSEQMYPEYQDKIKALLTAQGNGAR